MYPPDKTSGGVGPELNRGGTTKCVDEPDAPLVNGSTVHASVALTTFFMVGIHQKRVYHPRPLLPICNQSGLLVVMNTLYQREFIPTIRTQHGRMTFRHCRINQIRMPPTSLTAFSTVVSRLNQPNNFS